MLNKLFKSLKVFLSFLNRKDKFKFTFLSVIFAVSSLLEIVTIVLIIPILSSFSEIQSNFNILEETFKKIDFFLGLDNVLLTKIIILYAVVFFKNSFQIFAQLQISKYGYMMEDKITKQILNYSYSMPLSDHKDSTSSELIKNCTNDAHKLNLFFINPLLIIISDLILIVSLLLFLIIFDPVATFISGSVSAIIVVGYHYFSGKFIYKWGRDLNKKQEEKISIIQQIFYNLTQIQITNKINFFKNKFDNINKIYTKSSYLQQALQNVNRNIYEIVLFIGVLVIASVPSKEPQIVLLGAFALAAYKLLPSLNRMTSSFQSIQFNIPVVEGLRKFNINDNKLNFSVKTPFESLKFENISFKYSDSNTFVIKDIDFKINKGDFLGIVGDSGSGKSTLLSIIMGLNIPSSGNIYLNDNLGNPRKIKFGYVPQTINLINESIRKNIAFGYHEDDIDKIKLQESIKLSQLDSFINNLEEGLETVVGDSGAKLSGGQIQRIGIARALYDNPDIIVFDESTSSLDKKTENMIVETIVGLSEKISIIFVTHEINNLSKSTKLIKLD
jgi:ATP-binding cassette, subfamily B, bacterial PglK